MKRSRGRSDFPHLPDDLLQRTFEAVNGQDEFPTTRPLFKQLVVFEKNFRFHFAGHSAGRGRSTNVLP